MMIKFSVLILGGAIGTALRFVVAGWVQRTMPCSFPMGIMAVNLLGSFFIGLCWSLAETFSFSPVLRMLLFTGFFGGFTTFSTFALDSMLLLRAGAYKEALLNIVGSNLLGIAAAFFGLCVGKYLLSLR